MRRMEARHPWIEKGTLTNQKKNELMEEAKKREILLNIYEE
jgi:hypothetical protein